MKKNLPYISFYWLIISLIVPNVALSLTETLTVWGRITNVVLPLGILGLFASISGKIGKTVWYMLPFTFFAAFQMVLLSLYGNGIISVDMFLNLVTTNCSEACELLKEMWPILVLVIILYLVPLVGGIYCLHHHLSLTYRFLQLNRRCFSLITASGAIFLVVCYCRSNDYDMRRDLYPVNIGYNIYLALNRCYQTSHYPETSADFDYEAVNLHDQLEEDKYILVIGETSRAHDWQILGYHRPTNPRLSRRDDLIVAGKAYSESNTTHKSVPMLLSCVDAQSFDTQLYRVKSLISAFKECAYYTSFISNQLPNHSYIDYFGNEADTTIFVKLQSHHPADTTDDDLLDYVDKCLNSGHKKQLIVLHTYGSHFNYRERYTDRDRVFLPDNYINTNPENREELVNAYDNSIVATDCFLDSVIGLLGHCRCVGGLLYTSDHGEDIYDDNQTKFLHASPSPTEYQLHVPMMIWLSPEYSAKYPDVRENLLNNITKYISTSRSFCATSLAVAGIKSVKVDPSDDLTSRTFKSKPLYYLNDHNTPIPFITTATE